MSICSLLPYKRKDILSAQELNQKLGWAITRFRIPEVWSVCDGEGVTVAVVDTGVQVDHVDLIDNILPGYDFINDTTEIVDDVAHGSHSAGIIAAVNNSIGIVGVAPKAKIKPIKVLDDEGNGTIQTVSAGIRWAADQNVDFICLSLGTPKPHQTLRKAIKYAVSKGVVIFAAGGNAGNSNQLYYPANYPEVISVGAIDKELKRADFSNTGSRLDFVAAGVDILSTVPDNWYALMSGTSMATPFVCGLAALLLSYKKKFGLSRELKSAEDYRVFFRENTINISDSNSGDKKYQGFGIITLDKLLEKLNSR